MTSRSAALCIALATLGASLTAQVTAYDQVVDRKCARVAYFTNAGGNFTSPGQLSITYGLPVWKESYEPKFTAMTRGKRWRFGKDAWTTLDANITLRSGGTKIEAGSYYLVVARSAKDEWSLVLLDPAKVRKQKLDAFQAAQTTGGTSLPLTFKKVEESTPELQVKLRSDKKDPRLVKLIIAWGPFRLEADIKAEIKAKI